jgi:uncharacterized RDD family membrane protein YckC
MDNNPYDKPIPVKKVPENQGTIRKYSEFIPASPMARYVAAMTDLILIVIFILLFGRFMAFTGIDTSMIGFLFLMFLILIYEPVMVSQFQGTLGHKFFKLRVLMEDEKSNVSFLRSVVRAFLRWFLGSITFFWMLGKKRQALHDQITKTRVLR